MIEVATQAAKKKAKKNGVAGPFKPLSLRDLTEVPQEEYALIPSPATGEPGDGGSHLVIIASCHHQ